MKRGRKRRGKGFSLGEIQRAGLPFHNLKILGVSIDRRRKSSHPWNVQLLKRFYIKIPLTEITGIGKATSMKLRVAGVTDANTLANCNIDEISRKVRYSSKTLMRWQKEARRLAQKI